MLAAMGTIAAIAKINRFPLHLTGFNASLPRSFATEPLFLTNLSRGPARKRACQLLGSEDTGRFWPLHFS